MRGGGGRRVVEALREGRAVVAAEATGRGEGKLRKRRLFGGNASVEPLADGGSGGGGSGGCFWWRGLRRVQRGHCNNSLSKSRGRD